MLLYPFKKVLWCSNGRKTQCVCVFGSGRLFPIPYVVGNMATQFAQCVCVCTRFQRIDLSIIGLRHLVVTEL